jgi:hypothetical protein
MERKERLLRVSRVYEAAAYGGWEPTDPIAVVASYILYELRESGTSATRNKAFYTLLEVVVGGGDFDTDHARELLEDRRKAARFSDYIVHVYTQAARRFAGLVGRDMNQFFLELKQMEVVGDAIEQAIPDEPDFSDIENPGFKPPRIGELADNFYALYLDAGGQPKT